MTGKPEPLATKKEKLSNDYGVQIGKYIQGKGFGYTNTSRYSAERDRIQMCRAYAQGNQSTEGLMQAFNATGDNSHVNLDFTPAPIAPKFVRAITEDEFGEFNFEIDAVDKLSKSEKAAAKNELIANLQDKDFIESFEEALELEKVRKKGQKIPLKVSFPPELYYTEFAKFSKQVSRFISVFPQDQIKIYLFEEFKKDNAKVYEEILDFLNVDHFQPDYEVRNRGVIPKENTKTLFRALLTTINFFSILPIKRVLPLSLRIRLGEFLLGLFSTKKDQSHRVKEKTKKELKKEFRPEVKKLGKLIDRDLRRIWGYKE